MKLGGRERVDDEAALEELFGRLPVSPNWTMGFLAALGSGPEPIPTATWIPEIVGKTAADAGTVELLERLFGAAAETLRSTPEIMPPEPDKDAADVVEFATGYLRGAAMHAAWAKDNTARLLLGPFEEIVHPEADVAELRGMLADAVRTLYIHGRSKRQVVSAKVGRNDPCPCGSGKKHKKCCLAA